MSTGQRAPPASRFTINRLLLQLIAAVLLPIMLASLYLVWREADAERRVIEARRLDVVNNLSILVDGEIKAAISVLQSVANSADLSDHDVSKFRSSTRGATGDRLAIIALIDPSGQQVFSTAREPGEALPKTDNMEALLPVLSGSTVISEVLIGTVARRPVISVAVPVKNNGNVDYILSGVIFPERFGELFAQAGVNPQWASAIVDRSGNFVSRNLAPEKYIGKAARPELVQAARGIPEVGSFENTTMEGVRTANSFRRSTLTGWTTVVSVPETVVREPYERAIAGGFAGVAATSIAAVLLANYLARRISRSVQLLGVAAADLISGKQLPHYASDIAELSEVFDAYEHAASVAAAKRESDNKIELLLKELAHRSKNLLAIVSSMSAQTSRTVTTVADYRERLAARIQGLSATHDFLFTDDQSGVLVSDLARSHLTPFTNPSNVKIDGSCNRVLLRGGVVQSIGMAFNELATNAVKYGALSSPAGTITIVCKMADGGMELVWSERGGPRVTEPTRKGFGTVVTGQLVAQAVDGNAQTTYDPAGLIWRLSLADSAYSLIS